MHTSSYFVYIMSNFQRSTLYIGVTNNLERRVLEHQQGLVKGFTQKYKLKYLLFFEEFVNIADAIVQEKRLKNWHHEWKMNLIKKLIPSSRIYPFHDTILSRC